MPHGRYLVTAPNNRYSGDHSSAPHFLVYKLSKRAEAVGQTQQWMPSGSPTGFYPTFAHSIRIHCPRFRMETWPLLSGSQSRPTPPSWIGYPPLMRNSLSHKAVAPPIWDSYSAIQAAWHTLTVSSCYAMPQRVNTCLCQPGNNMI